ncbi:MAG: right-handed parallel beta-helix repeat-containing protein [Beijerinckiaceae bacterium]|nr:right-handed parallel beta-helix repeat-containing protein [Beijerinckiaceae bacterium]
MLNLSTLLAFASALALIVFLGAAPALALSPVTYVSGTGANTGICASPAAPCRSFQFAHNQTSAGGEIKALDSANYGPVTITKSISITGIEGAGVFRAAGSAAITINAGPGDTINLSHLTLDGFNKTAVSGILLNSGGSLTITHCSVRNFKTTGIGVLPTGNTVFLIADVAVSDAATGIFVNPQGTGSAHGTLDHVSVNKNTNGIFILGNSAALSVESTATNDGVGFLLSSGAVLRLAHSSATGNDTGVFVPAGTTAESAGNNFIRGNTTDVVGTLTNVGTQ